MMADEEEHIRDSLRRGIFTGSHERDEVMYRSRISKIGTHSRSMAGGDDKTGNGDGTIQTKNLLSQDGNELFWACHKVLSLPLLLDNIGIHLPKQDLLNCRLVCGLWANEMGDILCKRKSLVITDEQSLEAHNELRKRLKGETNSLSRLSMFDISSSCVLYKKIFRVFGRTLSSVVLEDCALAPEDFKILLVEKSPNIENLSLRETVRKTELNTFQHIKSLNNGTFVLPKLKYLHWDEVDGNTGIEDIAQACPNLVTLELRNFPSPVKKPCRGLRWDTLQSLFLSSKNALTKEHCDALINLQLKLNKLTLFGIDSHAKEAVQQLAKFLASVANTLEVLELWLDYKSLLGFVGMGSTEFYSPIALRVDLPRLKRLHTETSLLGNFKYLKRFPAMTDLEIVSNTFQGMNWSTLTKRVPISCQTNLSSFRCGDIDGHSLKIVMKTYPRITTLELFGTFVTDAAFKSIVKYLPDLESLTIRSSYDNAQSNVLQITDSGLTGVSKAVCTKYLKNPKTIEETVDWSSMKSQPGISDLTRLQTLNLSLQDSQLTDAAIFYGIARLAQLTTLRLPMCMITDLSLYVIDRYLRQLSFFGYAGCRKVRQDSEIVRTLKRRRVYLENSLDNLH